MNWLLRATFALSCWTALLGCKSAGATPPSEGDAGIRGGGTSSASAANDVCGVAEACGVAVFARSKETFRPNVELVPRTPEKCQRTLDGLRAVARAQGRELPPPCK